MAEVLGLGLDLIDLSHFEIYYGGDDPELLSRCFTEIELADAGDGVDRGARLAVRFAVKEAVFKALGGGAGIAHTEIELVHGEGGEPRVRLISSAAELARKRGVGEFLVSLTHSGSAAAAVVIALSGGPK